MWVKRSLDVVPFQYPYDPRRYGYPQTVVAAHPYYRYVPSWLYDPYRLNMAGKEENIYHSIKEPKVQAIAYAQAFDNAGYVSTSSLRKGGSYSLGELTAC